MVYVEINGVRLDQMVLLAIGEGILSYGLLLWLLITVHCPCIRPRAPHLHWLRGWRTHATIYALLAMLAEGMWVQLGMLTDTKVRSFHCVKATAVISLTAKSQSNAIGCPWTQSRLAAWGMVQLGCWMCLGATWTYCRRRPVAPMVNGVVAVHSTSIMVFAMLTMYEGGACASAMFPLLAGAVGMLDTCCCVPWYGGAWSSKMRLPVYAVPIIPPPASSRKIGAVEPGSPSSEHFVDVNLDEEAMDPVRLSKQLKAQQKQAERTMQRDELTCWGFLFARRRHKKRKRAQRRRKATAEGAGPILAPLDLGGDDGDDQGSVGAYHRSPESSAGSSPLTTSDDDADAGDDADDAGVGLIKRRRPTRRQRARRRSGGATTKVRVRPVPDNGASVMQEIATELMRPFAIEGMPDRSGKGALNGAQPGPHDTELERLAAPPPEAAPTGPMPDNPSLWTKRPTTTAATGAPPPSVQDT